MGFIQTAFDSAKSVVGDQWRDVYTVPTGLRPTAALFPAVKRGANPALGTPSNVPFDVITNGSRFVVPPGYGLALMEGGSFTGLVTNPGSYVWHSEAPDSQSVFTGGDLISPLINTSWERFKFGGQPTTRQRAFFVCLKELPNNKFGTSSPIYWDDSFLNAQVGAVARGSYTLRITDPILFIHNLVPVKYIENSAVFDFTDLYNDAAQQLFHEVVGSLSPALSRYTNDPTKENRITRIQQDSTGFAQSLSHCLENNFHWKSQRGLEIVSTSITSIEYDPASRQLLNAVQRADALSGGRGNSNLQASIAAGIEAAGANEGASGVLGVGFAASGGIGTLPQQGASVPAAAQAESNMARLQEFKRMLTEGLITESDYEAAKAKVLGL